MSLRCVQHEVLCVEVDEGIEEDVWGVNTQLTRLPKVLLRYATNNLTCSVRHLI